MQATIKPFQIVSSKDYLSIRLSGFCDPSNLKEFLQEMKPYIEATLPDIIVNCEQLLFISSDWIRQLLKVQVILKQYDKSMRLILVNSKLMQIFREEGVDKAFKFCSNLKAAMVDLGLIKEKVLDTNFVNPFLDATLRVLKIQAGIDANAGKIYLKKTDEKLLGDISGVIGIVSESFNGSVVISFPEKTFLAVMSGMLGEVYTEVNKDILDGAGEITNMIFGQAKVVLNDLGYGIKTAIPTVISGKDHSMSGITNGTTVVVPFQSTVGEFFAEICLSG